ncbi:MAG: hypothetical protein ABEK50_12370 [bacterium]
MAIALLALLFISLLAIGLNLLLGEFTGLSIYLFGEASLAIHMMLGIVASLVALFSVVITMFYFIGTGKAVKETVQEWELDERYYQMVLKYKKKYFPTMTLALVVYIAAPSVGAAASAEYVSDSVHRLVSYVTFLTHGYICYQGFYYIFENDRLVTTVDRLAREAEEEATGSHDGDCGN